MNFDKPFWEVPQNTPGQIVCVVCKTPLHGGLETYGPQRFERCQTHFLNDSVPPEAKAYYLDLVADGERILGEHGPIRTQKEVDQLEEKLQPFGEKIDLLLEAYPALGKGYIPDWVYGSLKVAKWN